MMRPQPRAFMPGTAARMAWNADDRLMAMIASHFSGGKVLDRRDMLDAGIVDQDVDGAEGLLGLPDHGDDLVGLGHVGRRIDGP